MKKLFLLLASGSIALAGNAQQRSFNFETGNLPSRFTKTFAKPNVAKNTANKTTAAPTRVYNHGWTVDTIAVDGGLQTGFSGVTMWQDDKTLAGFDAPTGYDTVMMVSAGVILHPQAPSENNPLYVTGEMKITNSDAYVVNSVQVWGVYDFNPANTFVDTLVLSFVKGNAGSPSTGNSIFKSGHLTGGHYGNIPVVTFRYDTTSLNQAKSAGIAQGTQSDMVYKIPLGPSTFGDTTTGGLWHKVVTLGTSGISVPAGQQIGMSYSFRSGATTLPINDTIFYSGGVMKYNMWRPLSTFITSTGLAAGVEWYPYDSTDFNEGLYKTLPHSNNGWSYQYVPQWAWSSSAASGASTLGVPWIDWNITCTTCGNVVASGNVNEIAQISKVDAYPNPASTELNVPFTVSKATNVTVTLSNILGQVVAEKTMSNVTTGKAVFNTATLTPGLYTYSVLADGQRTTGKVSIQ